MKSRVVVVFTGRYASASAAEHVEAIATRFPDWTVHVVHELAPRRWRPYLRGKIDQWRRQPVSLPLELLSDILHMSVRGLRESWKGRRPAARQPVGLPGHLKDLNLPNVHHHKCRFLHSPESIRLVKGLKPWLGIAVGAPILRPRLFSIPERGTINVHKSLLPHYRGIPPGFWELYDGVSATGVSIHRVAEGLDTGDVFLQRVLPIPNYSTPHGLAAQLDALGTELLLKALQQIDHGLANERPQPRARTELNRKPSWLVVEQVRRRTSKRRRPQRNVFGRANQLLKTLLLASYTHFWARLRNLVLSWLGRCRVSVLLYHRVDDAFLDSVTVDVEQFMCHLEILQTHYDVLDLPTFLATRGQPRRRPAVVITFDDGYASSYLAAILLRRRGLPATFFLSTEMIETDQPFPHDVEQLGYRVPALDWPQVAQMAGWGFHFGSHTVNHTRLSTASQKQVLAELAQAQAELIHHTDGQGLPNCLAYPYGRRTDITDEVRNALHHVGVEYCFSAYGGQNSVNWEPLNILRGGIDVTFSDVAFRAAVEGWRVSE